MTSPADSIASFQRLSQERPRDAALRRQLGNLLLAAGAPEEALASYRDSLKLEPHNVRAHNNAGQALLQLGRIAEATRSFEQALELDPGYATGHNNLGNALAKQGLNHRAIASYRRAAELQPALAEAHVNCGNTLLAVGEAREALACFERALALNPSLTAALVGRGNALQPLRRFDAARAAYDQALRLNPDDPDVLCNCANALLELKRPADALAYCDRALQLRPDFAEAYLNRSGALRALHRCEEAVLTCDRVIALKPDDVDAYCNRGLLMREMGDQPGAEQSFRQALRLNPKHAAARTDLMIAAIPAIPATEDDVRSSRVKFGTELAGFADWVHASPDLDEIAIVGASQPFFLAYQEFDNRELLSRYGRLCSELMARWQQRHGPGAAAGTARRGTGIRVALVSAQIRDHSVYRALIKGWLHQLDPSRFEVGVVHVGAMQDTETEWARQRAAFFLDGDRTLAEWGEAIRDLKVDVLIYPEIGMDPTTLRLASLRLARHQIAAWGHPETSGLPTIDHYLSAELLEPAGSQDYYSERLVRLPHLGCYYEPYETEALSIDLAASGIAADVPVLLCPGASFKYAPQYDAALVEIARRLGRCQLVFFRPAAPALSRKLGERLAGAFRAADLDPEAYLVFIPWQSPQRFFGLLGQVDLYLDTLGFSGFNTAMQAVECGVPLVTYEGRFMRGRLASAIVNRMGLTDLVARNAGEYVDLAVKLIEDRGYNRDVRGRLQASRAVLYRDGDAIAGLADFLSGLMR